MENLRVLGDVSRYCVLRRLSVIAGTLTALQLLDQWGINNIFENLA